MPIADAIARPIVKLDAELVGRRCAPHELFFVELQEPDDAAGRRSPTSPAPSSALATDKPRLIEISQRRLADN